MMSQSDQMSIFLKDWGGFREKKVKQISLVYEKALEVGEKG